KILGEAGVGDLIVCDSTGIIYEGRARLNPVKAQLAASTNRSGRSGGITEALKGADVLVGVSGGSIPESALEGMADNAIVFALANPTPEVAPETAAKHAAIVATGRSDYPNQIN
ncbi:malate dehydrogenase, partial [Thermoactinomyces vulgaris]